MRIEARNLSKKFNRELIFRDFCYEFEKGQKYAITGSNGSGKSTLLKILSAYELATKGEVLYTKEGININQEEIYQHVSFCAPYQEIIEDFTLSEIIDFQSNFKPWKTGLDSGKIIEITGLSFNKNKPLKQFSSGMRQRVKLILCLLSASEVKFLDEPTTNLDQNGVNWYLNLIEKYTQNDLLLIASNDEREYTFCEKLVSIHEFKP